MYNIIFFGSFQTYSNQVLHKFIDQNKDFKILAVVTTPPRPAGRNQILTPTPTHQLALEKQLPVFPLESLNQDKNFILTTLDLVTPPDFIVTAGYGKLIPPAWLSIPTVAPVNVHFSLLPQYPGRFPAEWAILTGEEKTGVTIIRMSPEFDKGEILSQEEIPITSADTRQTLYTKLYDLGGDLALKTLPQLSQNKISPQKQDRSIPPKYARQITRDDGFLPFEIVNRAQEGKDLFPTDLPLFQEIASYKKLNKINAAVFVDRMARAFDPWPGLWTTKPSSGRNAQRLKILKCHLKDRKLQIDLVQFEGKTPQPPTKDLFSR